MNSGENPKEDDPRGEVGVQAEMIAGALPGQARGVPAFDLCLLGRNMVFGIEKVNEITRKLASRPQVHLDVVWATQ